MGPLASRLPGETINPVIEKITNLTNSNSIDVSVPNTALRTLISSLPQPQPTGPPSNEVKTAYGGISRVLIPRLVGRIVMPQDKPSPQLPRGLLEIDPVQGYSADAIDVLIEVVKCYGTMLQDLELAALSKAVMDIIESPQAGNVVKKRALAGVGALLTHFSDTRLSQFVSELIESFRSSHLTPGHRRYLIATIGALARATPAKFGPFLKTLAPFVLSAISQEEFDEQTEDSDAEHEADQETEELREATLVTLEALIGSCTADMQRYLLEAIDAALRYLKYDPNVAEVEDEDMDETQDAGSDDGVTEEAEDDQDDEFAELDDDDAFSDVDDLSWKVRRCAAKVLYTIISTGQSLDNAALFDKIAPALITRMQSEREENVKFEVISAVTAIIKRTGQQALATSGQTEGSFEIVAPSFNSRKRRRQDSDASLDSLDMTAFQQSHSSSPPIMPASPTAGPQADLAALTPKLIQALVKLWKKATIPLKQATVKMLRTLTLTRNGAIADYLQRIEDPIADALKPSASGSGSSGAASTASATAASLQIETLSLISVITETNPTSILLPFVIALIPGVTATVRDRNFKVSSEALGAVEQFVKALTPPRLPNSDQDLAMQLEKLYEVILDRVADNNADLEVRHRAIQVFGVLLARTSSTKLLKTAMRIRGFDILKERLANETTRLSSARAVSICGATVTTLNNVSPEWVRTVSLELGSHLRKADRSLRWACLDALKSLALNSNTAAQYDDKTIGELTSLLLPLLTVSDLHLLTPTLVIFARIIPTNPTKIVNEQLVKALTTIVCSPLVGSPLKALLLLVKVIGEQGAGETLMKGLLAVGTGGEVSVVGRSIGTLVVYGGPHVGVSVGDFQRELQASQDEKNRCLSLAVLGEVGLRTGPSSPVAPSTFLESLQSESDKVRVAAAVALGSAGSNNIPEYMPLILANMGQSTASDYLLLHTVKEILQHPENIARNLTPYAKELWQKLFVASNSEDNLAVGAECIGRLAMIDPGTYLPELHQYLQDTKPIIRGTVITAFRFTLADSSDAYNAFMKNTMVSLLMTMLNDQEISNRRLAVTTLNSAIHNKPDVVMPELGQILPIVLRDTHIKPELLRQVSFGPFKITVDDGLDLRKSAYETLYALLDTPQALSHVSIPQIYDRILDGIPDDHDIRTLCNLMIGKLANIDPDETWRRLPALSEKFKIVLSQKAKENAVKQEIEKLAEANAAVVRTSLELDKKFPMAGSESSGEMVSWKGYLDWMKKEFVVLVRSVQDEGSL
jgi:cullin-associated NEDD8-dissociated protein 1